MGKPLNLLMIKTQIIMNLLLILKDFKILRGNYMLIQDISKN